MNTNVLAAPVEVQQQEPANEPIYGSVDLFKFKFADERGGTGPVTAGCIVSMMDDERPFIHSFTNGERVQTIAFVNGLPIPFNLFVLILCTRMAPNRVAAQVPTRVRASERIILTDDENRRLAKFWRGIDLSAEMRERVAATQDGWDEWKPVDAAKTVVNLMLSKHMTGEDETSRERYVELIQKIDEDYAASLIDPRMV